MVMIVIYCNLWSSKQKSFYVWMIYEEVNVVCHSEIDGCNLYRWSVGIVSYSCGVCGYSNVVTLNNLCMNHDDLSCNVCETEIVSEVDFTCPCLHGSVVNMILHGGCCEIWVGDDLVGFLKEVSCVDNP